MLTMKLKYKCSDENYYELLKDCQRMYSSWLHYCYNRIYDTKGDISDIELRNLYKNFVNNIHLNSWIVQCGIKDARQNYNSFIQKFNEHINKKELNIKKINHKLEIGKITKTTYNKLNKIISSDLTFIFGGKRNFNDRNNNKISKEEYKDKRLSPIYFIGEKLHKGNRCFDFNYDFSITYKHDKNNHYNLKLYFGNNQKKILEKIITLANEKKLTVSIKLNHNYIYISYDESLLENVDLKSVKNRVLGIDMNPNYIGVTIVDWKSSSEYKVIDSLVYDMKLFSDEYHKLNSLKNVNSSDERRIYLSNKKDYEIIKITQNIISLFKHYRCDILSIENLKISNDDKDKGKNYNALCNNHWLRTTFVNGIKKRCNLNHIKLIEVKPEFSSFIGNFLFREQNLPDMCLASIEIGRRGYEYYNQYIEKTKEKKKNIICPDNNDFIIQLEKSLEEFNLKNDNINLVELYYSLKTKKDIFFNGNPNKVRLHIDEIKQHLMINRFFSHKSLILLLK